MIAHKRKTILLGFIGLVLIILGIKYIPVFLAMASKQSDKLEKPVILFISVDEPCECMVDLTQRAEQQIANWPPDRQGGIPMVRIAFGQRQDLQTKYLIFRAPCLLLVDEQDQVAWRQDYPLIEGGPFELEVLEVVLEKLGTK
jgi:hypothetical protein